MKMNIFFKPTTQLSFILLICSISIPAKGQNKKAETSGYDIAAYVWPSYHHDERAKIFWPDGIGEWQTVISNKAKFDGHEQPRYPLWGYINEADPYVSEMEINAAVDHGINIFIFDWYWYDGMPFLEGHLNNGYLKARNNDRVKFFLMWANHDVDLTWDKRNAGKPNDALIWKGSVSREEFEKICHRVIDNYFSHSSYYKIDEKPVFMIYDIDNLIQGLGGVEKTIDALDWFRKETVKAGFKGLNLQLTLRRRNYSVTGKEGEKVGTQEQLINRLGFDGLTHYQYVHFVNINRDYSEIIEDVKKEFTLLDNEYKIPYYPHISVGWDNNPRFEMFRSGIVKNNTPENFEKALRDARSYVDAHPGQAPLITINSWNEWTETSYLMPDNIYGYAYLEAIKKVFGE